MADADSTLEVLIKTVYESTGVKLAEADAKSLIGKIDNLKISADEMNTSLPEGSALWAKYKNVLHDTTQEANKLGIGHRQLLFTMEQMGVNIPGLGFLLRGMLTPATVATIGIALSWELWNKRIEEGTEALAGMHLPDLSQHISGLAQATANARAYAEALRSVTDAYNSIDAGSDRLLSKIKQEAEEQKKLVQARRDLALAALEANKRSMSEADYARTKAAIEGKSAKEIENIQRGEDQKETAEKKRRESELRANAAVKREAAARIKVASGDVDENNLADAKAQADAAKAGKATSQEWIGRIAESQDSKLAAFKNAPLFYLRYGFSKGSEATKIEQSNIANDDAVIKRYEDMLHHKASRDDDRTHRQKLIEDAGKMQGEADVLRQSIPQEVISRGASERNQAHVDHLKQLQQTMREGDQASLLLLRDIIKDRGDTRAALKDLSGQLKNVASRTDRSTF